MAFLYLYILLAFLVALLAQIRGRAGWRWFFIGIFATPLIAGLLVMALPRQQSPAVLSELPLLSEEELARGNSTLRIIRPATQVDRFRPYSIYVDGALAGAVVPNNVSDFRVPSGTLVIEARSDWGASPPLLVNTAPGHRVDIEVSNRWGPSRLWAILFSSDRYLTLRNLSPAGADMAGARSL
jgi:hypothetical protein